MDGFKISVATGNGSRAYAGEGGQREFSLAEAVEIADRIGRVRSALYATIGNGEHEFRRFNEGVTSYGTLREAVDENGPRWAEWFVDVEIEGERWQYRPLADLREFDDADELAEVAAGLADEGVTRVWVGKSDGSECTDWETREG